MILIKGIKGRKKCFATLLEICCESVVSFTYNVMVLIDKLRV